MTFLLHEWQQNGWNNGYRSCSLNKHQKQVEIVTCGKSGNLPHVTCCKKWFPMVHGDILGAMLVPICAMDTVQSVTVAVIIHQSWWASKSGHPESGLWEICCQHMPHYWHVTSNIYINYSKLLSKSTFQPL